MKTKIKTAGGILSALLIVVLFSSLTSTQGDSKNLTGAWEYGTPENHTVLIISPTAFAVTHYDLPGKKMMSTYGGAWKIVGDTLIQTIEFSSANPDEVGTVKKQAVKSEGSSLVLGKDNFTRIDAGKPGALAGAWIFAGRNENGKFSEFPGLFKSRRTMKILSGTRFQWIAYDIDSKKFFNTGGGTYTTADGKYTETIEFFTKTPESVGKSLSFNFALEDGHWRHSGASSSGAMIDERWANRKTLEK
ncbi:membrane or secreted protein [Mucilaginibacter hurinus]|uniref:Membrane or secreted protein n=1 Tax=Mucilaginibacter hurinus TaxID=2201324 RepID=A0A367GSS0_9SPHI|nr:membrane or secreted protein [Mucilaginibacter hurinus]RCH56218.1 membrane or secreted protein [Mucilaginibacter hurinus]